MQSLDTGESPVLTVRIPADLHAAVEAAAGPGRGAKSRWLRSLLERETTDHTCKCATTRKARP